MQNLLDGQSHHLFEQQESDGRQEHPFSLYKINLHKISTSIESSISSKQDNLARYVKIISETRSNNTLWIQAVLVRMRYI